MDDLFSDRALRNRPLAREDIERLPESPQHLIDCDLEEADLSRLDLSRWTFERCTLRRTDFSRARLEGTAWRSCRGAFADFTGSNLSEAIFAASDFNNASFRRSTLEAARFERCKLTGADLSEMKAIDAHFDETLLINAKLPGHSFRKAVLKRVDFTQASATSAWQRSMRAACVRPIWMDRASRVPICAARTLGACGSSMPVSFAARPFRASRPGSS